MRKTLLIAILSIPVGLTAAAVSASGDHPHAHAANTFPFGQPASEAMPDREIQIEALDSMTFTPEAVTVAAGETVKFVVVNKGLIPHSFSLNTPAEQEQHERDMQSVPMDEMMTHMDSEPNGFVLEPGETKTLVWRFTGGGPVQFACHIPGHFPAGMIGEITVQSTYDDHEHEESHGGSQEQPHGHERH